MKKFRKFILSIFIPIICLGLGIGIGLPKSFASAENNGGAIYVGNNSTFILDGSKSLSGFSADNGGAIYVANGGTLKITGGDVFANTATVGAGIFYDSSNVFEMTSGTISGNTGAESIYLNKGTFNMSGGTIAGNKIRNALYGGAVFVGENATMNMSGGSVTSNINDNGAMSGSIVVKGYFNMTGGAIVENMSDGENIDLVSYDKGNITINAGTVGNVQTLGSGTFCMNGGVVGTVLVGPSSWGLFYGGNVTNKIVVGSSIIAGNSFGDNTTFEIANDSSHIMVTDFDGTTRTYNLVLNSSRGSGIIMEFDGSSRNPEDIAPDLSKIKVSGYDTTKYKVVLEKPAPGVWILVLQSVDPITFDADWYNQISIKPTKVSFLSEVPSGYVLGQTLKSGIKMYKNSSATTEIAFVHGNTIFAPADSSYLFAGKKNDQITVSNASDITKIDFQNFDTSKVTSMKAMFWLSKISEIDVSGFNTSNVTTTLDMFKSCKNLKVVDISTFDMSQVTQVDYMFSDSGIKELHLPVSFTPGNSTICYLTTPEYVSSPILGTLALYFGKSVKEFIGISGTEISNSFANGVSSLKKFVFPETLQKIGTFAFKDSGLEEVYIPKNVSEIGAGAFAGCNGLRKIDVDSANATFASETNTIYNKTTNLLVAGCNYSIVPSNVTVIWEYAFGGFTKLQSVILPSGVTTIYGHAFLNCTSLSSINFPDKLGSIGEQAFQNCALTKIVLPEQMSIVTVGAFNGCPIKEIVSPYMSKWFYSADCETVRLIGSRGTIYDNYITHNVKNLIVDGTVPNISTRFANGVEYLEINANGFVLICNSVSENSTLKKIKIAGSNVTINDESFRGYKALSSVEISGSNATIRNGAFYRCSALSSLSVTGSGSVIMRNAFQECTLLETMDISGVTTIETSAFANDSKLKKVVWGDNLSSIQNMAFYKCTMLANVEFKGTNTMIYEGAFAFCSSLSSLDLSKVQSVGNYVFQYCSGIYQIELGTQMKTIGNGAFQYCSNLRNIYIPENVNSIGDGAFNHTGIESVTFQESVNNSTNLTLGIDMFHTCTNLSTINFSSRVKILPQSMFYGCTSLTSITIPSSVSSFGKKLFRKCTNLKTFDSSSAYATSFPDQMFSECSSLTTISYNIPLLSWIGASTFEKCTSLHSFRVGYFVNSIGAKAFDQSGIESVTFERTTGWTAVKDSGYTYTVSVTAPTTNAIYLKTTYLECSWQIKDSSSFISVETEKDESVLGGEYETAILPNDKKGLKLSLEKVEKE